MKKITLLLLTALLLSTLYSCNKVNNKSMTVVRDCTGVYLKFRGNDYLVCNLDKLSAFANGVKVNASFENTETCSDPGQTGFVCLMIHKNKGWIIVTKVE